MDVFRSSARCASSSNRASVSRAVASSVRRSVAARSRSSPTVRSCSSSTWIRCSASFESPTGASFSCSRRADTSPSARTARSSSSWARRFASWAASDRPAVSPDRDFGFDRLGGGVPQLDLELADALDGFGFLFAKLRAELRQLFVACSDRAAELLLVRRAAGTSEASVAGAEPARPDGGRTRRPRAGVRWRRGRRRSTAPGSRAARPPRRWVRTHRPPRRLLPTRRPAPTRSGV